MEDTDEKRHIFFLFSSAICRGLGGFLGLDKKNSGWGGGQQPNTKTACFVISFSFAV